MNLLNAANLPRETYPAEYTLFEYGEEGECAYLIEEGQVRVLSPDNRCLAILAPGALFGEVALLDQQVRTATVRTIENTVLIKIDRTHVEELLKRTDPVICYLLHILLERFRANYLGTSPGSVTPKTHVLQQEALRTLTLTRDLSYALDNDKPTLFYQPIVDCATLELVGFEALIRWPHPTLGMIMPGEFIGLAEKTGLIHPLGLWVLNRAIADWATLRHFCAQGPFMHPFLSVNVSADELYDERLIEEVFQQLSFRQIPPEELKIELTETVVIEDRERVGKILRQLTGRGVGVALDDFGTGFASMEYLRTLPISTLKIDKGFVQEMLNASSSDEIVQSAIRLAGSLGMTTVAEGVENEQTVERLAASGCQLAQGFYFAEPMPATAVSGWLARARLDGLIRN